MKKLRLQLLVVIVTLLFVAVLLFTQDAGTQAVSFVPQPATGGIYSEALIGSISRLNPLLDLNNPADRDIDRLIFSGLIRFDSRGMPMPDLAESWGVSQDGTIYNFSIRPNAIWHDGQPVTSDDVIFTIELIKNDVTFFPLDVRDLWKQVQIKRLNDKTLQFVLPEPYAPFLDYLTFGVLPQHLLGSIPPDQIPAAEFNLNPVGSGPYKFDRLVVSGGQVTGVELSLFTDYYGQKPFIQQVVFRYYPSSEAALAAFREGEVLAISQITPDVLPTALAEPTLSVYTGRLPEMSMVLLNHNSPEKPFLKDPDLRRALLLAINRQRIVDRLLGGQGIVAHGPIFPGTWAYYENTEQLTYDPQAAIDLLKRAGYQIPSAGGDVRADESGNLLEFSLVHPDDALHTAIAQSIQETWAQVGVRVTLEALPYEQMVNEWIMTRGYQAALVDLNLARLPDPDPYPFWHQFEATSGQNYTGWDNRTASEYLEQARINTDFDFRTRLYRNFQVVFGRELPALPLYYPVYSYGVSQQVLGVQVPPLFDTSDRFLTIGEWYLVTRRGAEESAEAQP